MPFVVRTTRGVSVVSPASSRTRSTHGPEALTTTEARTREHLVGEEVAHAHAVGPRGPFTISSTWQ